MALNPYMTSFLLNRAKQRRRADELRQNNINNTQRLINTVLKETGEKRRMKLYEDQQELAEDKFEYKKKEQERTLQDALAGYRTAADMVAATAGKNSPEIRNLAEIVKKAENPETAQTLFGILDQMVESKNERLKSEREFKQKKNIEVTKRIADVYKAKNKFLFDLRKKQFASDLERQEFINKKLITQRLNEQGESDKEAQRKAEERINSLKIAEIMSIEKRLDDGNLSKNDEIRMRGRLTALLKDNDLRQSYKTVNDLLKKDVNEMSDSDYRATVGRIQGLLRDVNEITQSQFDALGERKNLPSAVVEAINASQNTLKSFAANLTKRAKRYEEQQALEDLQKTFGGEETSGTDAATGLERQVKEALGESVEILSVEDEPEGGEQ